MVKCELCEQECDFSKYVEHLAIAHAGNLTAVPKGFLIVREIEDENHIFCTICKTLIHKADLDTHIETHNYESTGDIIFYSAPSNESQLTRIPYDGKGDESECDACLVNYAPGDILIYLYCGHKFHESCILDWIHRKQKEKAIPSCPKDYTHIFKQP